jgi:GNAT superfamily N-acetyltransferase
LPGRIRKEARERMISFEKARKEDAKALALASWHAFDDDVNHGAPTKGGPPGYRSAQWQARMMKYGSYYKIVDDYTIIGGFIVFAKAPGHYELGRIFVDPAYQDRGIGADAMRFMEVAYPTARLWTLDTPIWNARTQRFYEKMGFVPVGQGGPDGMLVLYEKKVTLAKDNA